MAQGTSGGGEHWTVRAGGTREQCWTILDIELPDGRQAGGGGMGGPSLPPGRLANLSEHRSDPGLHYVVGRVHPTVKRIHLEFANNAASGIDLEPAGESAELGVAFVAEVLPSSLELMSFSAWDAGGRCIDERSTAQYRTFFNQASPD